MELAKISTRGQITLKISSDPQARATVSTGQKQQSRADSIKKIRKLRARCKPVTVDEILAWRDEGRS
jgi:hypothetical protein